MPGFFKRLSKSHQAIGWLLFIQLTMVMSSHAETVGGSPVNSSHIRTLAATCAACHGMQGNSVSGTPVLAGLDKNHFILQMNAFRSGERSATVMQHHAKGLTLEEIDQLGSYFSEQKRTPNSAPAKQTLDTHGEY